MSKLTFDYIGQDFPTPVGVGGKLGSRSNPVLVYYSQAPETGIFRIEVLVKREGMVGVQPAVVEMTAFA